MSDIEEEWFNRGQEIAQSAKVKVQNSAQSSQLSALSSLLSAQKVFQELQHV
jgi:hypothetical protein